MNSIKYIVNKSSSFLFQNDDKKTVEEISEKSPVTSNNKLTLSLLMNKSAQGTGDNNKPALTP